MSEVKEVMVNHAERVREFYRKQGSDRELERIIKLLKEVAERGDGWISWSDAIALIKGENK